MAIDLVQTLTHLLRDNDNFRPFNAFVYIFLGKGSELLWQKQIASSALSDNV